MGYRGTGKSTVGQILANRLDRRFLDADLEIEARAGRSISRSSPSWGSRPSGTGRKRRFASWPTAIPAAILATGGGAVVRPANRRILADHGLRRLAAGPSRPSWPAGWRPTIEAGAERPSLTGAGTIAEIAQVLEARNAFYAEVADAARSKRTGARPEEIAEQILALWPRLIDGLASRRTMAPCSTWVRSWCSWVASSSWWGRSWAAS